MNAVLRALSRDCAARLPLPPRPGGDATDRGRARLPVSVTLSHPRWLVARWLDRYGFDAAEAWCSSTTAAPLTLRAIGRWTTRELLAALTAERRQCRAGAVRQRRDRVASRRARQPLSPALAAGVLVQDEASQLVAHARGRLSRRAAGARLPAPRRAAKTVVLAARSARIARPAGRVRLPREPRAAAPPNAAPRRRRRARRGSADATQPLPFEPVFDAVLVDAPCSGLGTLRRDPDIEVAACADDLAAFGSVQRRMLGHAAQVVAPGGRLVYATCSSEPEENEAVVDGFLASDPRFRRGGRDGGAPVTAGDALVDARGYLRTLPVRTASRRSSAPCWSASSRSTLSSLPVRTAPVAQRSPWSVRHPRLERGQLLVLAGALGLTFFAVFRRLDARGAHARAK